MRQLTFFAAFAVLLTTACVHRPYYKDLVGDGGGQKEMTFRLLDAANGKPLANVPVKVAAGNDRISVTTDTNGIFKLPVKKSFMDPYTVVEVVRPTGIGRYTIEPIVEPSAPPAQPTSLVAPTEEALTDAGA